MLKQLSVRGAHVPAVVQVLTRRVKMNWCEHLTWNDCGRWKFCDKEGTFLDHPINKGFDGWKLCPICGAKRPEKLKTLIEKIHLCFPATAETIVSIVREHMLEVWKDWYKGDGRKNFDEVIREQCQLIPFTHANG